jgi:hypothetical protein
MGLRDFLANLQSVQQLTGDFAAGAEQMRKQAALQQLSQQAPDLLASGDTGQVAALAASAGDATLLRELLQQKVAAANKPVKPLQAKEALTAVGIPENVAGIATAPGMTYETQQDLLKTYAGTQEAQRRAEDLAGRQQTRQFNMTEKPIKSAASDVSKAVANKEAALTAEISGMDENLKLFKKSATPQAANFLIRSLIKASGDNRVSDQDIAGFQFKSLGQNFKEAVNFLQGTAYESLSPAQQQEAIRLAEAVKEASERKRSRIIGDLATTLVSGRPELLNVKGAPSGKHAVINELEKKTGLIFSLNRETGFVDVKSPTEQIVLSDETPVTELIKALKGEERKQAEEAIAQFAGTAIPDKVRKKILEAAKKSVGR